jgi:hypothetical protein
MQAELCSGSGLEQSGCVAWARVPDELRRGCHHAIHTPIVQDTTRCWWVRGDTVSWACTRNTHAPKLSGPRRQESPVPVWPTRGLQYHLSRLIFW